jgi:hypothetical protein
MTIYATINVTMEMMDGRWKELTFTHALAKEEVKNDKFRKEL